MKVVLEMSQVVAVVGSLAHQEEPLDEGAVVRSGVVEHLAPPVVCTRESLDNNNNIRI